MSKNPGNESKQQAASSSALSTASSIDQLTLSYLRGDITFQEYETMIENQHFLAIAASTSSSMTNAASSSGATSSNRDHPQIVSSTIELVASNSNPNAAGGPSALNDRFFNLNDILADGDNDDEDDDDDDDEEGASNRQSSSARRVDDALMMMGGGEDTMMSQWNDFDIETLNFDKFIKDHQTENKEASKSASKTSNKRKRGSDSGAGAGTSSSTRIDDPNELKAKRRRNRVLPIEIQGLMGEANLSYARGETNKAIDTCLEVIKYAPKAPEPFQLLSLLYAEQGQNSKSLKVGLIAAQLNKDPQEWEQLIQQAMIEGDIDLTLFCYNNAIQCDLKNVRLHVERIRVLEEKRDVRRLMVAKLMLLKYVNVDEQQQSESDVVVENDSVQTPLAIYRKYFEEVMSELRDDEPSDRTKKIYVLKNDMKKFKDKFEIDKLKLLIKLLISQKSFTEAVSIIANYGKIQIKPIREQASDTDNTSTPISAFESLSNPNINEFKYEIPDSMNSYIRAQLIVCLINLDYQHEDTLIKFFLSPINRDNSDSNKSGHNIEMYANELLLIADTYYVRKSYEKAKNLYYVLLTNTKEFLVHVDVWLRYGNCCNYLNEIEEAINAYRNAVNLDQSNCEAALSLVNILKKNASLFDEAAHVIRNTLDTKRSKGLSAEILNLMINECLIQYEQKNYTEFIKNSSNLLFGGIRFVLEPEHINVLIKVESKAQRAMVFHQILDNYNYEIDFNYNKLPEPVQNTIFDIFLKLCKVLASLKRHDELLMYTVGASVLPLMFERSDWSKSINFACLIACILKNDGKNAFNILKHFVIDYINSNKLWSYVGIVVGLYPSLNQQKFFVRLGAKYMDHLPLCLINAHFAIMSGTYRYALVEYMNCFKQNPYDPFINLIISITYCHISCQKYNTKRHILVSQSLVFLRRYIKYRGICQETYYNTARVMHQLSLFDLAAHYYQKCLDTPCTFPNQKDVYDLSRHAAYNLISIYKHSGSIQLARNVMMKYLTI